MLLASTQVSRDFFPTVGPWLIALLGAVLLGAVIIYMVRRLTRGAAGDMNQGFALEDLRRMHREGELTDSEFARAKAALIGRLKAPADHAAADNGSRMQNESN